MKRALTVVFLLYVLTACAGVPQTASGETPLTITTTSLPDMTSGEKYKVTLEATGGVPPYKWALKAGTTVPSGMVFSAAGVLSGTYTDTKCSTKCTVEITFVVTDSSGGK
jgi:hypothetical protein